MGKWIPALYSPNYILHNAAIWQPRAEIDAFDVAAFLRERNSALLIVRITPRVNCIIKEACLENNINPRWVLATLQKEQGLIEGDAIPQRMQYAMGYGVTDSGVRAGVEGFTWQIRQATTRMREYALPWAPIHELVDERLRRAKIVDGIRVTAANLATAACYTYTPHLRGNKLLWNLYLRYWPDE